jgi:hypothetical protein
VYPKKDLTLRTLRGVLIPDLLIPGVGKGAVKNRQADKRVLEGTYNIVCAVQGCGKPGFFNPNSLKGRKKYSYHHCINNERKSFSRTTTFAIKDVKIREFKGTEIVIIY